MTERRVLVGDVGGTNVRFAMAVQTPEGCKIKQFEKLVGDDFSSFYDALADYLSRAGCNEVEASFALAGEVEGGAVSLTNRDWRVTCAELEAQFGFRHVSLMNDFAGMARAVPEIPISSMLEVKSGQAVDGRPILVTGLGTGLGVATLLKTSEGWSVISGEGGHMAFAPETAEEFELSRILLKSPDCEYVSNELVSSGIGLKAIYPAFCEMYGSDVEAGMTPEAMQKRAEQGDEMFRALLRVRAHTFMRSAGDLVIANGTKGGVIFAGGVTEHILDFIKAEDAIERFCRRGLKRGYVETCPIHLMRDPMAPLIGAAAFHFQHTG